MDNTHDTEALRPIANLVGLSSHDLSEQDTRALQSIYDFVRGDAPEISELDLVTKVRGLEHKLGMNSLGERRIDKLYRHVRLQNHFH